MIDNVITTLLTLLGKWGQSVYINYVINHVFNLTLRSTHIKIKLGDHHGVPRTDPWEACGMLSWGFGLLVVIFS